MRVMNTILFHIGLLIGLLYLTIGIFSDMPTNELIYGLGIGIFLISQAIFYEVREK